jgi:hypothetical protein
MLWQAQWSYVAGRGAIDGVTGVIITSASTASNVENTTLAHSLTANKTVTWSIVGGVDAARFDISGSTMRWLGNATKDFEAPNDANTDNAYIVQVRATDSFSNIANQTITVTVTDVVEIVVVSVLFGAEVLTNATLPTVALLTPTVINAGDVS